MTLPLHNQHVVITRSSHQAEGLAQALQLEGATVLELPLISVESACDRTILAEVLSDIATYEWIVFTSINGVHSFFEYFLKAFADIRSLGLLRIACIGEGTAAAIRGYHLQVDIMPEVATSESLAEALMAYQSMDNTKVLVVTGNLNRDTLVQILSDKGRAIVDTIQVYATKESSVKGLAAAQLYREKGADAVLFTSPSAVASFVAQAEDLKLQPKAKKPILGSIGPSTSKALRDAKLKVGFEAKVHSIQGLVQGLIDHL